MNFLTEINVEMSDLSSMDSIIYRFKNESEQFVINSLMLNDQKSRTHFEVRALLCDQPPRPGLLSLNLTIS